MAKARRVVTFGLLLALLGLAVPDAGRAPADFMLLKVQHARAVERPDGVLWVLALGSDARKGQSIPRSRADSLHLVGINPRTGHSTIIGIPRDSYVPIPGHGSNKINSSMSSGGPQLTARAVQNLTGLRLDYVFLTDFSGFATLVHLLGGIKVHVPRPMSGLEHRFAPGMRHMNGSAALAFSRIRYGLPRGDFDRSLNQGRVLKAAQRKLRKVGDRPGRLEHLMFSAVKRLHTDASPVEIYRLGRMLMSMRASKATNCVAAGRTGYAGSASVVFLDRGALRGLIRDARGDARLNRGC